MKIKTANREFSRYRKYNPAKIKIKQGLNINNPYFWSKNIPVILNNIVLNENTELFAVAVETAAFEAVVALL